MVRIFIILIHIMTIGITQRRDQDRTMSASYVGSLDVPDIIYIYLFLFLILFIKSEAEPKDGTKVERCVHPT